MNKLCQIHMDYVVAPADKAANNFIIICKKYYLQTMCKEMGVLMNMDNWNIEGNDTYKLANINADSIFKRHRQINGYYKRIILEENENIPVIFAIPKLHKN